MLQLVAKARAKERMKVPADQQKLTVALTPSQAQFNPGGPRTINVVRVMYQLPTYLSILGGTSNIFGVSGGTTKNVILATAVFQTEPYGS